MEMIEEKVCHGPAMHPFGGGTEFLPAKIETTRYKFWTRRALAR